MSECNCGYGGFHEPMNPNCNLNQTPERDLVTDEDVRAAWTAWSDPGDDRWTPERYDQWLADHDERVREQTLRDFLSYRMLPSDVRMYVSEYLAAGREATTDD